MAIFVNPNCQYIKKTTCTALCTHEVGRIKFRGWFNKIFKSDPECILIRQYGGEGFIKSNHCLYQKEYPRPKPTRSPPKPT